MIKYNFTCEYTKIYQRRFEEVVEYDHKPDDDELEADYNAWLSDYIVGGYQCLDEGQSTTLADRGGSLREQAPID